MASAEGEQTWLNAAQPTAPWQASVTSEGPKLSRGCGDLVDDAKHQQDEDQCRQSSARGSALRHVVELHAIMGQLRSIPLAVDALAHNLNVRLGIRRCDELLYIAAFDNHESCELC